MQLFLFGFAACGCFFGGGCGVSFWCWAFVVVVWVCFLFFWLVVFFVAPFFLERMAMDEDVYSTAGGKSDLYLWTDHCLGRNEVDW